MEFDRTGIILYAKLILSFILLVAGIFGKAQNPIHYPKESGLELSAHYYSTPSFSLSYYVNLSWPFKKTSQWTTHGLQVIEVESRTRVLPRISLFMSILEKEYFYINGSLSEILLLKSGNALDIFRDYQKFSNNIFMIIEVGLGFGYKRIGLHYHYNFEWFNEIDIPKHAISLYYKLPLKKIH